MGGTRVGGEARAAWRRRRWTSLAVASAALVATSITPTAQAATVSQGAGAQPVDAESTQADGAVAALSGDGDRTTVSAAATSPAPGSSLVPLEPARLLESRAGQETVDGLFEGLGRRAAGSVTQLQVTDRAGVGSDAGAVVLNVTAVAPSSAGFLTVFPCGSDRPLASNVNYGPGDVVPNAVIAKVGTAGKVCVFTSADTHLVVDVNAWFREVVSSGDLESGSGTVVLDESSVVSGSGADGSVVRGDAAADVAVGSIVALPPTGAHPEGLLGKVVGLEDAGGGNVALTTEPVSIEEAFPSGDFEYSGPLTPQFSADAPAALVQSFATTGRVPLRALTGLSCSGNLGASAGLDIGVGVSADVAAHWGDSTEVRVVLELSLSYDAYLAVSATGSCKYEPPSVLKWTAAAGPVPLSFAAGSIAEATLQVDAMRAQRGGSVVLRAGAEYVNGRWNRIFELKSDPTPLQVTDVRMGDRATGSLSVFFGPSFTVKAWDAVGLALSLGPEYSVAVVPDRGNYRCEFTREYRFAVDASIGKWFLEIRANLGVAKFAKVKLAASLCGTVPPPNLQTTGLPAGIAGLAYATPSGFDLRASGGAQPLTWSAAGLPPGITLNDGVLSGRPSTPGSYPVRLTVRDAIGRTMSKTLALEVKLLSGAQQQLLGKIAKVGVDTWYIDLRGGRHPIPDGGTYECLVAQGKAVVETTESLSVFTNGEAARCVRAEVGDIVASDGHNYLVAAGFVRRHIPDGGTYLCLPANDHAVVDVPSYWLLDLAAGADYRWSCWNATSARGKSVRASDGTSYYVDLRGGRHWMPDGGTYDCLVAQGKQDYGNVVPKEWVDDLPEYEHAKCVRAAPGNIIRHNDGDAYLVNANWTRSWIKDGGSFECLRLNGHPVVNDVPRYYIDDLAKGADVTRSCWSPTGARGRSVRASDGTSWYIDLRGGRHWMPDGGTYECLVAQGKTDWGSVVPIDWVDDLPQYEHAKCVRANPGDVIAHADGDAYLVNPNWTRSWIKDGGIYECLTGAGRSVVGAVPRYYIDDLTSATDLTFCPTDRVLRLADGTSWYVGNDLVKHPVPNGGTYLCLTAWKRKSVVGVSQIQANLFTTGSTQSCTVTEANNRVIKVGSSSWFVDTGGVKHPIPNGGTYLCLTAWKNKSVMNVTQDQADAIPTGSTQSCTVTEANNRVIKVGSTSWFVDTGGVKHPIPNGGTYLCLTTWKGKSVMNVTQDQADAIPTGSTQSCTATEARNRIIRKSDSTAYYVDSNLVRHWIPNGGTYTCARQVRNIALINNVSQGHIDALPEGSWYKCRAIVIGPGNWRYYIDQSGDRFLIPGETNEDPYLCLSRKSGVIIRTYSNWNTINLFREPGPRANCGYD